MRTASEQMTALASNMINEDNAREIALKLTRMLIAALRAGNKDSASYIRTARVAAFDRYEELFGLDVLDELLDECDQLVLNQ